MGNKNKINFKFKKKYFLLILQTKQTFLAKKFKQMPLNQLNNSLVIRNKQNASEIDPQSLDRSSPIKPLRNNNEKGSHTKNSSFNLQNEVNQLKIKLADRQFQLKKLQEDCSLKISMVQKQLNRQKNEKKNLIKQHKQKLDEQKHYCETKITLLADKIVKQFEKKDIQAKKQLYTEIADQKERLIVRFQAIISEKQRHIDRVINQKNEELSALKLKYTRQIEKSKSVHQNQLKQWSQQKQKQIEALKEHQRAEIEFYRQADICKSRQHNQVEKIFSEKIRNVQSQIVNYREQIRLLAADFNEKETQLSIIKKQREDFRLDSICWQRKFNRLDSQLTHKYQQQLQMEKLQFTNKLSAQIEQFQANLLLIQSIHNESVCNSENQRSLLEERCKQISSLYTSLKSNEQDLKKIQMLEMKLIKKQFQLDKQREDLRICKLQLSNMDQIYHKMFEEAKVKSLKSRKFRLPALGTGGKNRSTMDCYGGTAVTQSKEQRKFSIREMNYQSISKNIKDINEIGPYQ